MSTEFVSLLYERSCGYRSSKDFIRKFKCARIRNLELNLCTEIKAPRQHGSLTWIDADKTEERYVLSAGGNGSIALFDLDDGGLPYQQKETKREINSLFFYPPVNSGRLENCNITSSVQWYPVDTGMFITAHMSGFVRVWDTNQFKSVLDFNVNSPANIAAFSPSKSGSNLIAAGLQDPSLRLCDIRSRGCTHRLSGHTGEVWAIAWCPINEYILASGGTDCCLRMWDIRRSGRSACFKNLDQQQSKENGASDESEAARAHIGPVNSLVYSSNGSYLFSTGADNRLKQWEMLSGRNMRTHYLGTNNRRKHPMKMVIAENHMIFFPEDKNNTVVGYEVVTNDGVPVCSLKGHLQTVRACDYRSATQEVITASADGLLLLWSPAQKDTSTVDGDENCWSSEDDERVTNGTRDYIPPILQEPACQRPRLF